MSFRIEKINSSIWKIISEILMKELSLKKGVFLTISKVDTSKDLRYTRIFLSVYPIGEAEYVKKTLKKETYSIQGCFNKKMGVKVIPRIEFIIDEKQERVSEVEEVFEQIRKEKEQG